jgi:hypothetical protein
MEIIELQEHIQEPSPSNYTVREKLVANILYYSKEKFEERDQLLKLAFESEAQLVDRLISILDYYYDQTQEIQQ